MIIINTCTFTFSLVKYFFIYKIKIKDADIDKHQIYNRNKYFNAITKNLETKDIKKEEEELQASVCHSQIINILFQSFVLDTFGSCF